MLKTGEGRRILCLSALLATILLLLFSQSSPLYPANAWGEANCFFTMGRGMLAGKVPYVDLKLGVGPLVCGLHALAALLSSGSFLGVWILEIIALTASLFFAWWVAARLCGKACLAFACVGLTGILLVSSRAFVFGDTVEEFVLPLQLWALCGLLDYLDDEARQMPMHKVMLYGIGAGCVLLLKYQLLGVHLVCIGAIAVDSMARERKLDPAAGLCLVYLGGMALAVLPWVLYLGLNGALDRFFELYFYEVSSKYALYDNSSLLWNGVKALMSGVKHNPAAALAVLPGAAYLLNRLAARRWSAGLSAVAAAFVSTVLMAFGFTERFRFTPLALGAFLLLSAGPLACLIRKLWKRRRALAALALGGAIALAGFACAKNESLPFIGYSESELPQTKFAKIIAENGGGDVLVRNYPDGGFYLAAGVLPASARFAESDVYYSDGSVFEALKGKPEWLISRERSGDYDDYSIDGYTKLAEAQSCYVRSTKPGGNALNFKLYIRDDLME